MTRDEAHAEVVDLLEARGKMTDADERRKAEDRTQYLFGFIDGCDATLPAVVE